METLDGTGREENPQNPELDSKSAEYHKLYYFPAIMFTEEMAPVRQFEEAGDYRKALDALERIIEKQPDQPQYLNHKASLFSRMERLEEAKELLLRIISGHPDNLTAREHLAMIHLRMGDHKRSEEEFLELLKIKESNPFANYMIGVLKFKHDYRKTNIRRAAQTAVEYFERAAELKPDFIEKYSIGHYELITTYAWSGQMEKAIGLMDKCITKTPEREHYFSSEMANIAIQQQQFWKAIELKTRAIELDPTNAMDYNERGRAYSYLHQHLFALKDYDKAIELDSGLLFARQNRAWLYVRIMEWDKALEDLDYVLERWPNYYGYYNRAIARLRTGELDSAREDVSNARKLGGLGRQMDQLDELDTVIRKQKNEMSDDIGEALRNGHLTREALREMVRNQKLTKRERKSVGDWHGSTEKKEKQKNGKNWRSATGRYARYC